MRARISSFRLIAAVLALALAAACSPAITGVDDSPIDISGDPEQTPIQDPLPITFSKGGYDWVITPRASYVLRGRVLSRKNYRSGWNAVLSPCDVAMAWGKLVEDGLYEKLDWSQSNRWYWWEYGPDFSHENTLVARYSSNTHIIPATPNVARAAKSLGRGDIAELRGDLVRVDGRKGGNTVWWNSSLARTDQGDGSCEVLYLRSVRTGGRVYE